MLGTLNDCQELRQEISLVFAGGEYLAARHADAISRSLKILEPLTVAVIEE